MGEKSGIYLHGESRNNNMLFFKNTDYSRIRALWASSNESPYSFLLNLILYLQGIGMFDISAEDFCLAYPYHICFDKDLLIEHVGE